MSYEIFTTVARGDRQIILKGVGEHEGTSLLISDREFAKYPPGELAIAEALDRRFLVAHADRLSREAMRPALEAIAAFARAFG